MNGVEDWIHLAQNRVQERTVMNTPMSEITSSEIQGRVSKQVTNGYKTYNMWYSKLKKKSISRHILHQHWYTCPIALPVRRNPRHRSLLTVVSATSAPPFQPLRHERNLCLPVVNRFTRQTLPTVKRKHFFMNILYTEPFRPQKNSHNRTLFFGSTLLKNGRYSDFWNQPLNMRMRVCYLDSHEAGLCCYPVIHKTYHPH
jgi:hypothetical protein